MEVPKDYVLNIVRQALDDKIDMAVKNLKSDISKTTEEINELKCEIKEFHVQCKHDMSNYDKRIRATEEFKIKSITIAGGVAAISAFIFTIVLRII